MSVRYSSLHTAPDAEQELNAAFDSDDIDIDNDIHESESTPLNHSYTQPRRPEDESITNPRAYDFEREYDFPPPGSPPIPTSRALPNDYGNSNGLLPTSPVRLPRLAPSTSFFRKAVGALLPSHYVRVPTEAQSSRTIGGGMENDGVFANVMAKPQRAQVVHTENGEVYVVPEDSNQKDIPPSYADAQADAVPPYWETTIHAPASRDPNADMIVDDMPTGSFWVFTANCIVSFFFQFVGFLLTYLLHTSHAGKYGSRAGLGLTLIQFGFYSRSATFSPEPGADGEQMEVQKPHEASPSPTGQDDMLPNVPSRDWLAFLFMTLGWFLLLSSSIGYWRVKRWEKSIRSASTLITAEDIERDIAIRRNLESVLGITFVDDNRDARAQEVYAQEQRLTRDLRAAGLI